MKTVATARRAAVPLLATLLSACVYAPPAATTQRHVFQQHPGVYMDVWWTYDAYGGSYVNSRLVNGSTVDKCAWTDTSPSRLVRAGESWQLSQARTPGNVGVSEVTNADPNCVNARR